MKKSSAISIAKSMLALASEREVQLETELPKFTEDMLESSDEDDQDMEAPILESIYMAEGNQGLMTMTNFSSEEFDALWNQLRDHVLCNWNIGRGRKSKFSPKDVLLMLLSVLKRGEAWDVMAMSFGISPPSFEKLIMVFLNVVSEFCYENFVEGVQEKWNMTRLSEKNRLFRNKPWALYATDVRFQQSNRPSGNHAESKAWFSGKHKLYGLKTEVSVLPIGFAIDCTNMYKGSVSDKAIMQEGYEKHRYFTKKNPAEKALDDQGEFLEHYPDQWAILVDKGYQGCLEGLRVIHPKRKPKGGYLTKEEKKANVEISSDRITVENFFGRLCQLWGLMSKKYRWNLRSYDQFSRFAVSMTNFHISKHPLRKEDSHFHARVKARMKEIAETSVKKRQMTQRAYREKRKRRMSQKMYVPHLHLDDAIFGHGDDDEDLSFNE